MTMNDYESNFYYSNRHNHDAQVVKKAPKNRSLGAKEPLKVHARVRKEPQKGGGWIFAFGLKRSTLGGSGHISSKSRSQRETACLYAKRAGVLKYRKCR